MSATDEASVFSVWQQAAKESCALVQFIGNFTEQPYRFEPGATATKNTWTSLSALQHELAFWDAQGSVAFEIWTKDLINADQAFLAEIKRLSEKLAAKP